MHNTARLYLCSRRALLAVPLLFVAALSVPGRTQAQAGDGWAALNRPGAIVLFRHTTAPGVGDPAGYKLGDCATQRNLSDEGRAEARRLGEQFRARGVRVGQVISSQFCRTRETAQLAFGNNVTEEAAFNSTIGDQEQPGQMAAARALLQRWKGPGVLVVVSHNVNIQALVGVSTAQGDGVVLHPAADGQLRVVGRIAVP